MYSSKLHAAVDAVPVDVVDANVSAYNRMLWHDFNASKRHFLSTMVADHWDRMSYFLPDISYLFDDDDDDVGIVVIAVINVSLFDIAVDVVVVRMNRIDIIKWFVIFQLKGGGMMLERKKGCDIHYLFLHSCKEFKQVIMCLLIGNNKP